jgi:hypothetical protein
MLGSLSNRCRTATFLKDHDHIGWDIFTIIKEPCPRLVELCLEMPYGASFHGIKDLSGFPSLKSLILIGDMWHLQFSQPFNLRKLGVRCDGWAFRLPSLLELLAKIPLLEEFEVVVQDLPPKVVEADALTPVVLKHLQRIVFRGPRSKFSRTLSALITHPNHTEVILTHYLHYNSLKSAPPNPHKRMFPPKMQLPIASPPKFIRYRVVQDEDSSETRCCIDLISVEGQHISIENRYGWPGKSSLEVAKDFASKELHAQCFGFLRTLDLSFVEGFCIEQCSPNSRLIEEVMRGMVNLATLVVVNGCIRDVSVALRSWGPPAPVCPLLRRLVVRQDVVVSMGWHTLLDAMESRAALGSPLERVILTSSFNELPQDREEFVERLERVAEVTYDFGRNTFGWVWWKV